ncbi:serine hydrolase domain-containing protein [Nocardia sp. NPDC058058]|uniref:serine hydrolase domain-containing protein n=1 Tax=Nocardia sp. NPDC058058 TaxID=3346317 RepID=UPI0036DF2AB6
MNSSLIGRFSRACVVALVLATAIVGCGSHRGDETPSFPAELASKIDEIAASSMTAALIPGMMVAVIDPERGSYVHAYGVSDIATGRPATIHDSVRIGSITKTFTATAVLRLVDEGKISLDDRLDRYVDHIPYGDVITLRDLLDMRAGVWDVSTSGALFQQLTQKTPATEWREGDFLRAIVDNPDRATPPNTRTTYSNSNFFLLGLVLEKVTGKPVREVLDDLANRYGLHETSYPADATMRDPVSHGYAYFDENPTDVTARTTPATFGAAGSMVSTISDLAEYAGKLGRGDLLRPETFRERARVQDTAAPDAALPYGLGLMVNNGWLGHEGAVLGYTADVRYLPERKLTVVVAVDHYTVPPASFTLLAPVIWSDIVGALYPGTQGEGDNLWSAPTPPVPSADELTSQLRQTLDPNVPLAQRPLRGQGDAEDPDLTTRIGSFFGKLQVEFQVKKVTRIGQSLYATADASSLGGKSPMVFPLVSSEGQWRIDRPWACAWVRMAGDSSPACK